MSEIVQLGRKLLTVAEVAEQLGIGRSLAYELILEGALKSVRVGRRCRRIPIEAVDDYVRSLIEGEATV